MKLENIKQQNKIFIRKEILKNSDIIYKTKNWKIIMKKKKKEKRHMKKRSSSKSKNKNKPGKSKISNLPKKSNLSLKNVQDGQNKQFNPFNGLRNENSK